MVNPLRKRLLLAVAAVLLLSVVVALAGIYLIQREIRGRIVEALGPLGSAEKIDVGLSEIRLDHVVLRAPADWPAPEALRADQITLTPDLHDLLAHRFHIRNITVSGFDMSMVRAANGTLRLLPNLRKSLSRPSTGEAGGTGLTSLPAEKLVDHIVLEHGTFEFYDLTVSKPAYKVTVTDANATVDHLHLPALTEPTMMAVNGSLRGPAHTGQVSFDGWIVIANKDSQTTSKLQGVDVAILDPYLLKKAGAKAAVTGGTVDMTVTSTVHNDQLHAPGTLTLHNLRLADTGSPLDTFMSIPTRAAVAALKTRHGDITVHFVLQGNLRDPRFSVTDDLMTRLSTGFAQALGVSVEGVAKGAGDTVKGLGNALKNLLGP